MDDTVQRVRYDLANEARDIASRAPTRAVAWNTLLALGVGGACAWMLTEARARGRAVEDDDPLFQFLSD